VLDVLTIFAYIGPMLAQRNNLDGVMALEIIRLLD